MNCRNRRDIVSGATGRNFVRLLYNCVNTTARRTKLRPMALLTISRPMAASARLSFFNAESSPKSYWRGPESQEMGRRGRLYLTLNSHHQNDSCIKTGSDKSRFNVSLIVMGSHKTMSTNHKQFLMRKESRSGIEPWSLCLPA